ncbi:MAG: BCCT family transporter [Candidatus Berkiella sp.]
MPLLFAMQYKKYTLGIFAILLSTAIGSLSLFRPNWLILYTFFIYIFGYLLLWMCITPAGNVVLGAKEEASSLGIWFCKLLLGQLVLLIFTAATYVAYFSHGPSFVNTSLSLSMCIHAITDYTHWMWGIFPWGIIGFWGLILAYIVYVKKGQPFFYQLARGFFPKRIEPVLKSYVEARCMAQP